MSVTRVNHFTAAESKTDQTHEFLKSLLPYITAAEGCLSAEVLRNQEEHHKFVVIERWQTQDDHRAALEGFPKETMEASMALFAEPPSGAYYNYK